MWPANASKRRASKAAAASAARWNGDKENIPTTRATSRTVKTLQDNEVQYRQTIHRLQAKLDRCKQSLHESNKRADAAEKKYSNARHLASARLRELVALREHNADQAVLLSKQDELSEQLTRVKKANKALKMRQQRSIRSRHRAIAKAVSKAMANQVTIKLKNKGVIPANIRRISRGLVSTCGVSAVKVPAANGLFARALGFRVQGKISAWSVGRTVREGGVAARLQIAQAASSAKSITLSHDGMSHKNRSYATQNLHVVDPSGNARKFFCGVVATTDHTSETGLGIWKTFFGGIIDYWNASPLGTSAPLVLVQLTRAIRGVSSDHAANERRTARLIHKWCQTTDREARGREALLSLPPVDLLATLCSRLPVYIESIGGAAIYQLKSAKERQEVYDAMYREIAIERGQEIFDALPDAVKRAIDLFVWCGCCMHKDLNATKAGNTALMAYWSQAGTTGPVRLMNKAQTSAAASSDAEAAARSELAAGAGGVKVAMLCGLLFRNKSDKLGQQDTFKIFFKGRLGRILAYPDTSNTRFQSYLSAAAFLFYHRKDVLDFMEEVKLTKDKSPEFTNLEKNIVSGLSDISTLTELAAIALYAEAISYPYMREVRGQRREHANALRLGPLHTRVVAHCKAIIDDADRLLVPSGTPDPSRGALDGKAWENADIVEAIHKSAPQLPHLRGALVAFFEGALDAWVRFSAEYETGGAIDSLSEQERDEIFVPSTNDACEGAVGDTRQDMRANGNITLLTHNSKSMFRLNDTESFVDVQSEDVLKFIRTTARVEDALGLAKAERVAHANHKAKLKQERLDKMKAQETATAARNTALDAVVLRLDVSDFRAKPGTRAQLDDQLDWHRSWHKARCGNKCPEAHRIPLKSHIQKLQEKLDALVCAVEYYTSSTAQEVNSQPQGNSGANREVENDFMTEEMTLDDLIMYG